MCAQSGNDGKLVWNTHRHIQFVNQSRRCRKCLSMWKKCGEHDTLTYQETLILISICSFPQRFLPPRFLLERREREMWKCQPLCFTIEYTRQSAFVRALTLFMWTFFQAHLFPSAVALAMCVVNFELCRSCFLLHFIFTLAVSYIHSVERSLAFLSRFFNFFDMF